MGFSFLFWERGVENCENGKENIRAFLSFEEDFEGVRVILKIIRGYRCDRVIFLFATRGVSFLFVEVEVSGDIHRIPARLGLFDESNPTRTDAQTRRTVAEERRQSFFPFLFFLGTR